MANVLIVEDEPKMRRLLELNLSEEGWTILSAGDAETGLKIMGREGIDLVLCDIKLPGMDGMEFLQAVRHASDYVLKPFSLDEIKLIVRKELDVRRLRAENVLLREELRHRYEYPNIVACSAKMQEVLATVERAAPTNSTILIGGESGVGKDLIARAIHQRSRRASGPFVKINCTAIPENLLESELFGYEKGAFTGATSSKPGKFELADKGSLFLDEIGDVPQPMQAKLLRVLQEREFERLGGTRTIKVDVRLIAATNRDLRAALEEGTFREDLYYRLNVVPINLPPLREHKEDIPDLIEHILSKYRKESGKEIRGVTPQALQLLKNFYWPGNVRELENIVERAATFAGGPWIEAGDIHLDTEPPRANGVGSGFLPHGMTIDQWEDEMIREALRRSDGNKSQAARLLGLSRNALRYRLSKIGVADEPNEKE